MRNTTQRNEETSEKSELKRWKEYFEELMNKEAQRGGKMEAIFHLHISGKR